MRVDAPLALALMACLPLGPGPLLATAAGSACSRATKPPEFFRGLPARPTGGLGGGGLLSTLGTPELALDRPKRPAGASEGGSSSRGAADSLVEPAALSSLPSLHAGRIDTVGGPGRSCPELSGGVRGNCRRGTGCGCRPSACFSTAAGTALWSPGGVRGRDDLRGSVGCRLIAGLAAGAPDGSLAAVAPTSAAPLPWALPFPSSALLPSAEAPTAPSCPSHRRSDASNAFSSRSMALIFRVLGDGSSIELSDSSAPSAMSSLRRAAPLCSTLRDPHLVGDSGSKTAVEAADERESEESDLLSNSRLDFRREMFRAISGSAPGLWRPWPWGEAPSSISGVIPPLPPTSTWASPAWLICRSRCRPLPPGVGDTCGLSITGEPADGES